MAKQSRPYRIWANMVKRCRNPHATGFKYWGGRGITVCEKWLSFEGFWADMSDGYADWLSIDRIDNDRGYEPGNCRWATRQQQNNNKSDTVWVTAFGTTKTLADWARDHRCGVCRRTLWRRIRTGHNPERAIAVRGRLVRS